MAKRQKGKHEGIKLFPRGNPIARNPLMKKGGAHEKGRTAKRQQAKRDLQTQIPLLFLYSHLLKPSLFKPFSS